MENTQALSSESFSKWAINLKQSFDGLGDSFRAILETSDETAFIEMDPTWGKSLAEDFSFATCQSPSFLVHADELFSNGLLLPFFMSPSEDDSVCGRKLPASSESHQTRGSFLKRCWKLCSKIVKKHLRVHGRTSHKVQDSCISRSTEAVDMTGTKWKKTCQLTISDWSDIEKSIQEAVQHCKRSFEKGEILQE